MPRRKNYPNKIEQIYDPNTRKQARAIELIHRYWPAEYGEIRDYSAEERERAIDQASFSGISSGRMQEIIEETGLEDLDSDELDHIIETDSVDELSDDILDELAEFDEFDIPVKVSRSHIGKIWREYFGPEDANLSFSEIDNQYGSLEAYEKAQSSGDLSIDTDSLSEWERKLVHIGFDLGREVGFDDGYEQGLEDAKEETC